jgi:hypothetical protein
VADTLSEVLLFDVFSAAPPVAHDKAKKKIIPAETKVFPILLSFYTKIMFY